MYKYEEERGELFTDEGQKLFLKIRDKTKALLKESGAVRMQEIIAGFSGSSWTMLACVDRMVEIGEIQEIPNIYNAAGQFRIFVSTK